MNTFKLSTCVLILVAFVGVVAASAVLAKDAIDAVATATQERKAEFEIGASGASGTYSPEGAKTCVACHYTSPVSHYFDTPHAQAADKRTPFGNRECETCHGPSNEHANDASISPAVVFEGPKASPVDVRNKVCISCHESGLRMNWTGSQHETADVPCVSCHQIKKQKDPVLVKKEMPNVCFKCHTEQRAQVNKQSHHPIKEGKVVCSECHNPHGAPGPKLLKEATVNEVCFNCHAEKRGPMLWEHPPVVEDCRNCHNPHGSSQPALLTQRPPWLCQNCHDSAFHPSNANGVNPTGNTGIAFTTANRGCVNCHSMVHGSNHPSGEKLQR